MGKWKGKYVVLGDLNGHVSRDVDGYEGVHGGNGFGDCNAEGEVILCSQHIVSNFLHLTLIRPHTSPTFASLL